MIFDNYYPPDPVPTNCESKRDAPTTSSASTKVIVLSYAKSGASTVSNMFQESPDVFFINEPLTFTYDMDVSVRRISVRCNQSSTILAKVLRLYMWEADILLSCMSDLKVIHLIRDPRGIAVSRIKTGYQWNTNTFCLRFNDDAFISSSPHSKYPGRVITVRLEDIALAPLQVVHALFEFARVNWTASMSETLQQGASAKNGNDSFQDSSNASKNVSSAAFEWRSDIDVKTARDIQEQCYEAMNLYGYTLFNDVDALKDKSISSRGVTYSVLFNMAIGLC